MARSRTYDKEYKVQAVKLAPEIGIAREAREPGISSNTLHTWMRNYRMGVPDLDPGTQTPQRAMTLSEEVQLLRNQVKEQNKEHRCLVEENEFLEEAGAFFAASRRKSAKTENKVYRIERGIKETLYPRLRGVFNIGNACRPETENYRYDYRKTVRQMSNVTDQQRSDRQENRR